MLSAASWEGLPVQTPSPIVVYVETLAQELSFDSSLASRVRQEIEDHLWETAEEGTGACTLASQYAAIERFGDPRKIASQYVQASMMRQVKRAGFGVILVVASVFLTMMARIAWYSLLHWAFREDLKKAAEVAFTVNKIAFWSALIVATAGWIYIGWRRIPHNGIAAFRKHLRFSLGLSHVASVAILTCLVCDIVLLGLRVVPVGWSPALIPPFLTYAVEIACFAALLLHLRQVIRRTGAAMALAQSQS
jgi:hypothetical protein